MSVKEEPAASSSPPSHPSSSRPTNSTRLASSGPPSRASPALTSASPPLVPKTKAEADDHFARAQAMGLRLTREEYERTRAGVAAFLRAERVASATATSQPSKPSTSTTPTSNTTTGPSQPSDAPIASLPQSEGGPSDAMTQITQTADLSDPDPVHKPASGPVASAPARTHTIVRPGGHLSFFTQVVTPEPAHQPKQRPRLDEIGNAEEKRRRKERRARLREKLASMSEPECTPTTSFASSPPMRASACALPTDDSRDALSPAAPARVGLGLSTAGSTSQTTSPFTAASSPRAASSQRSRTVSASAIPCTSASTSLQSITSSTPDKTASIHNTSTRKISPGMQRLTRRAWVSPNGKLSLVPASSFSDSSSSSSSLRASFDHAHGHDGSPGTKAFPSSVGDDSGCVMMDADDEAEADLLDDGFEGANRAGWGTRARTDSGGSNSNARQSSAKLSSSAPTPGSTLDEGIANLGLLDRVMSERRSPRRLRHEAKLRDRLQRRSRDLTEAEKTVLDVAVAHASSQDPKKARTAAPAEADAAQLMPAPSLDDTARRRRITHARQPSLAAYKSVRWASSVASPVHERMTTKEHYEYSHHGIAPECMDHSLNDVHVDEHDPEHGPPSSASMPWLFGNHGLDSTPSRLPGSPMSRSGSSGSISDSLNVDLSSVLDPDSDDPKSSLFSARRGLLFGPSSPAASPARAPINRFAAGFSDPSLSQSPQRGPGGLFANASSPIRLSNAVRSRHRTNTSLGNAREVFGAPLGRSAVLASSPGDRSQASRGPPSMVSRFDTISPAAIFGNSASYGVGDALGGRAQMNLTGSGTVDGVHTQPLPEASKRWSELPGFDDDASTASGDKPINESPARIRAKSTIAQERLKAATAAATAANAAFNGPESGMARVSGHGTMDWGLGLPSHTNESAFSPNLDVFQSGSDVMGAAKKGPAATSGQMSSTTGNASATPKEHQSFAGASRAGGSIDDVAKKVVSASAAADPNALHWDEPDGSRVVKLVSEELQAAMEAGDFEEPPPRYYVLPPGFGATKNKPSSVSYAGLIGQAILTSSDHRLSLNEIYNWISTVHPFFERGDRGWQNSIRHNLSLNKSFIKVEREAHIPGKGGWWAIKEGHEDRFRDGLYSAAPQKASDHAGGSQGSSKKKNKKEKDVQASGSQAPGSSDNTPAMVSAPLPPASQAHYGHPAATEAAARKARKRQTTSETDSSAGSPAASAGVAAHRKSDTSGKAFKKSKLRADQQGDQNQDEASRREPFHNLTNIGPPGHHQHQYAANFATAETPNRPGQPFMASSSHGGSQSGMPQLTDSASSPPSSPPPMSDAAMPPPSTGPSFTKRKGHHQFSGPEAFFSMAHGLPGLPDYGSSTVDMSASGTPAHANFYHGGHMGQAYSMYSSQPSPLAERLRGFGINFGGSPLRRQPLATSTGGTSGKITSLSPVSSVRGSSLAGAMNMRLGSHNGNNKRARDGNGPGDDQNGGSGSGNLFNHSGGNNQSGISRSLSGQSQGAYAQSQAPGYSPMRGSPLRPSDSGKSFGSSGGGNSGPGSHALSHAGAELQNALAGAGLGSMGPAFGGLGFTSTNLTPSRITPNHSRKTGSLMGPSPSPTVRRLQAQQQGGGWLEDPFDFQGALQHEFENMGTTMAGLVGSQGGGVNGGQVGSGNSGDHNGGGMVASNYNPSPVKYGNTIVGHGGGLGSAWYGGGGQFPGFSNGPHQENVSAVRESIRENSGDGEV